MVIACKPCFVLDKLLMHKPAQTEATRAAKAIRQRELGAALKRNMARRKAASGGDARSADRASREPARAAQSIGQDDRSAEQPK